MKITIPQTIDQAAERCASLEGLARATGWERAAIVWAFTVKDQGSRTSTRTSGSRTIAGFAELGIPGLRSQDTVRRYHDAWQSAMDHGAASAVVPGDEIDLPTESWPPAEQNLKAVEDRDPVVAEAIEREATAAGITRNVVAQVSQRPNAIAAAIKADPKVAAVARRALDEDRDNRDLQALSRGGQVRSLEDINKNVGNRPLDGLIARLEILDRGLRQVEQGKATLATLGSLDDAEQGRVRDAAVALLDLFLDTSSQHVGA